MGGQRTGLQPIQGVAFFKLVVEKPFQLRQFLWKVLAAASEVKYIGIAALLGMWERRS